MYLIENTLLNSKREVFEIRSQRSIDEVVNWYICSIKEYMLN